MDESLPTMDLAPVFPLPQGALLPGELLPLHIFEPRYRAMMEAVRAGDGILCIATIAPGWEHEQPGDPPLGSIVGVGRVVKDRVQPDGTSDIVLHGLARGRIVEEVDGKPFRRARLLLLASSDLHPAETYRLRCELLAGLAGRLRTRAFRYDVTAGYDVGKLVDRIASSLELDAPARVAMLHAVDVRRRIHLLLELLEQRRHRQRLVDVIPSLHAFALSLDAAPGRERPR